MALSEGVSTVDRTPSLPTKAPCPVPGSAPLSPKERRHGLAVICDHTYDERDP